MCMHVFIHFFVWPRQDYAVPRALQTQLLYATYCFCASPVIIQVEGQNKGKGCCGCMCAYVCIGVRALRVGGLCLKEEVLSGTEAFCRCCREDGENGKSCGYHPNSMPQVAPSQFHQTLSFATYDAVWFEKSLTEQTDLELPKVRQKKKDQEGGREKSLKNMFTSGGWGWRRSLRFPSWSVSQSGGGWDSLLVPLDVTWGTLISVCLCLSPFLWPSLSLCLL